MCFLFAGSGVDCLSTVCQNGGSCHNIGLSTPDEICYCPLPFTGEFCETSSEKTIVLFYNKFAPYRVKFDISLNNSINLYCLQVFSTAFSLQCIDAISSLSSFYLISRKASSPILNSTLSLFAFCQAMPLHVLSSPPPSSVLSPSFFFSGFLESSWLFCMPTCCHTSLLGDVTLPSILKVNFMSVRIQFHVFLTGFLLFLFKSLTLLSRFPLYRFETI